MEKNLDLSGVDPARWPEIRRRVAILDEYVAIWRPTVDVRERYAEKLGISPSYLYLLARIWRKDRSAEALPGAKVKDRVEKTSRLPARTLELARAVIADLGPMARQKDMTAEVVRRCGAEGLAPPSSSFISGMMMEARAAADMTQLEAEILIDECVLKIPVIDGGTLAMPRVLLAVLLPQRRIIAVDIAFDPATPTSLAKVVTDIEKASRLDAPTLPVRAPHRSTLEREIIGAARREQGMGKPTLSQVLGPRLGDLPITYKLAIALSADKLLKTRHNAAIGTADATRAIMEAVSQHNNRMPAMPPKAFCFHLSPRAAREMASTL